MKPSLLFVTVAVLLLAAEAPAQVTYKFTLVHGSPNRSDPTYSYGAKGVPSLSNSPPRRHNGAMACDEKENALYLFGGSSNETRLNDLWKYNINTGRWIWLAGSTILTRNDQGSFGTFGQPSPTTRPAARWKPAIWVDSTNRELLLFGGFASYTMTLGFRGDLWNCSLATNQWAWIGGLEQASPLSIYGQLGVPSPNVQPGARNRMSFGTDVTRRHHYFFGGYGLGEVAGNSSIHMQDVWMYDSVSRLWSWVGGSPSQVVTANYTGAEPRPAGIEETLGYFDETTKSFWIFGGQSLSGLRSDVWRFDVTTSQFQYFPIDSRIVPSQRESAIGFVDPSLQRLIVFGGGFRREFEYTNELWSFDLRIRNWTLLRNDSANPFDYPTPRDGMSWCFMKSSSTLWFFGGDTSVGQMNDLWRVDQIFDGCPGQRPSINFICDTATNTWVLGNTNSSNITTAGPVTIDSKLKIDQSVTLIVNGQLNVSCGASFDINGQVFVQGSFSVCGNWSVQLLSPNRPAISVANCVDFSGSVINLSGSDINAQLNNNGTFTLQIAEFGCRTSNVPPVISLNQVPDCIQIGSSTTFTDRSLAVVFVGSNSCPQTDGAVFPTLPVAVGASVGFVVIVVLILVFAVAPIRRKVFPFLARRTAHTTQADD